MSQTAPAPLPPGPAGAQTMPLVVNIQYVKDMSFEVPGAPQVFQQLRSQPNVNINLDVQARRLEEGQNQYEVVLVVRAILQAADPPVVIV